MKPLNLKLTADAINAYDAHEITIEAALTLNSRYERWLQESEKLEARVFAAFAEATRDRNDPTLFENCSRFKDLVLWEMIQRLTKDWLRRELIRQKDLAAAKFLL